MSSRNENALAAMLEGLGFEILILDDRCCVQHLSESLCRALERNGSLALGAPCGRQMHEASPACRSCPVFRALEKGVPMIGEMELVLEGGQSRTVCATAVPFPDGESGGQGVALALKDITGQRQAEGQAAMRERFDALLGRMAGRLMALLSDSLPLGLEQSLEELGMLLGAGRCIIFEPCGGTLLRAAYQWRAEQVVPRQEALMTLDWSTLSRLRAVLEQGPLILPSLEGLSGDLAAETPIWLASDAGSCVAAILPVDGGDAGLLVAEGCQIRLSPVLPTIDGLAAMAEVLAAAMRRKSQGEVIREQNRLFRGIAESSPILAWIVDAEAGFTFCNRKWRDYTGWEDGRRSGWGWEQVVHEEDLPAFVSRLRSCIAAERAILAELRLRRRDGAWRWMQVLGNPVRSEGERVEGYVGVCIDITDHKMVEDQLLALNDDLEQAVAERTRELQESNKALFNDVVERTLLEEQLRTEKAGMERAQTQLAQAFEDLKLAQSQMLQREKMASIGQLAAGVAHEINNPMGFIISNLSSLKKYGEKLSDFLTQQHQCLAGLLGPEALAELAGLRRRFKVDTILEDLPELVGESLEGADRVKVIVQNLKGFSRLDSAEVAEADLNDCLESAISIAWNEIKYHSVLHRDFGDIPRLRCNPQQLNQVFLNILVNAAHAIEKNGEIRVSTRCDGRALRVAISDNGCGIPEAIRSRIFEPFFTTKEVGKGTGLGMSISYDIVKKHAGEIEVESEVGKGTTFTVVLPLDNGLVAAS